MLPEVTFFDTCLLHELRAFLSHTELSYPLSYFRTHDDADGGVFTGSRAQRGDGYAVVPYPQFLRSLWDGSLVR